MSGETVNVGGTSFRIKPLRGAENWMPWKRHMTAIFRELDLYELIIETAKAPEPKAPNAPTAEEAKDAQAWQKKDEKARTRIELAIADSEFMHIYGAPTAREQWKQLCMVYESRGLLARLAAKRAFFRAQAEEDFDMKEWIGHLRQLHEELQATGILVPDEEFGSTLLTSLPSSWDIYTTSLMASMGENHAIKSHELISILIDEFNRRKGRLDLANAGTTMQARNTRENRDNRDRRPRRNVECLNCKRIGHTKENCWGRGGGKEGQGPSRNSRGPPRHKRDRAHQTKEDDGDDINASLNDVAYITCAAMGHEFGKRDWIFDSATTSHICPNREDFKDYQPIDGTISGIGDSPVRVTGRGTVVLNFDVNGKTVPHTLRDVLHVPHATNCLVSVSRHDPAGCSAEFRDRGCTLKDKSGRIVGKGILKNKLYLS